MDTTILQIIEGNAPMTLEQIIKQWVDDWNRSDKCKWMKIGEDYYKGQTDILKRKRMVIGDGGVLVEEQNLANNQLVFNYTRKLVDQKIGYLLSKPMSIQTENQTYQDALTDLFGSSFQRILKNLGKEAVNKGIAWLHVYYDENGVLSFKRMRSDEIIPVWLDEDHTQLQAVIRQYKVDTYVAQTKKEIHKVEWWDVVYGVKRYIHDGGLIPDEEPESSHYFAVKDGVERPLNWERVPFIPFKANDEEQPLIEIIKTLVDDYDKRASDNSNNLEDLPNSIYVLKDYDGANLGEFRRNLSAFRAVKVTGDGGVDTIGLDINTEAFKTHQELLRKGIYEFGRGVDMQTEKFNGATGVALKQLYNDLDMDANILETEFQASLEQLLFFINAHLANTGVGDFSNETVKFVFNRDIIMSESDTVTDAKNSMGIISKRTIRANHPWVTDLQEEEEQIKKEESEAVLDYPGLGGEQNVNNQNNEQT
ncbi:phage portal protein [Paenibacillus puldeungensis]|uniref:Phage portal protein n=1 Tax=Paenibacillus puldeungensis TaxID=696536 RepID=A0ABW3S434_9BACL